MTDAEAPIKSTLTRRVPSFLAGCAVGGVLTIALGVALVVAVRDGETGRVLYKHLCADGPRVFERIGWSSRGEVLLSRPMRLRMAKSLVATRELIGMTEVQLLAKLGRSEMPPKMFGEHALAYHLCVEWIDDVWLVIQLSESGVCTEAVIQKT